jgi:putative membrane protein
MGTFDTGAHTGPSASAAVAPIRAVVTRGANHFVHGDTRYAGTGVLRTVYLLILASHVLLSLFVVPGALLAFYFAWRNAFAKHRKVTRWLAPIWLYVSVTGVVIFFMLRGSLPAVP